MAARESSGEVLQEAAEYGAPFGTRRDNPLDCTLVKHVRRVKGARGVSSLTGKDLFAEVDLRSPEVVFPVIFPRTGRCQKSTGLCFWCWTESASAKRRTGGLRRPGSDPWEHRPGLRRPQAAGTGETRARQHPSRSRGNAGPGPLAPGKVSGGLARQDSTTATGR